MTPNDLNQNHTLDEMLDTLEDERISYTAELVDSYFMCSREYWNSLSPEKQTELAKEHPHLLTDFEDE